MKKYPVLALRTASSPFSVFELDLDLEGAVVEKFGGSFAIDLVAFLAARPVKANRVAGIFDFEADLQGAEGDFAALPQ